MREVWMDGGESTATLWTSVIELLESLQVEWNQSATAAEAVADEVPNDAK